MSLNTCRSIQRGYAGWLCGLLLIPAALMVGAPAVNAAESDVVINEIMYHQETEDSADQFIELFNSATTEIIDLSGWTLAGDVSYTFPAGTRMGPQSFLVVTANPSNTPGRGPWTGELPMDGGTILLRNAKGMLLDRVVFEVGGSWPTGASGTGSSIELINPYRSNMYGSNWAASSPPEQWGTPGNQNSKFSLEAGSPLPAEWRNIEIGGASTRPAGSASMDGNVFVVQGAGADIWDNADHFHFVYRKLTGNGSITARVLTIEERHTWSKAGVMMREDLSPQSRNVAFVKTPNAGGRNVSFQWRGVTNTRSFNREQGNLRTPRWMRLTRNANEFRAYHSTDGNTWVEVALPAEGVGDDGVGQWYNPPLNIGLPNDLFIGLCVTSHDANLITTAEFDNVSFTGSVATAPYVEATVTPAPPTPTPNVYPEWYHEDIGRYTLPGYFEIAGTEYRMRASGADIWDNTDGFHYAYKTLTGDGSITARVTSITDVHDWAKAGVMIRETRAPGSKNAATIGTTMREAGLAQGFRLQVRRETLGGSESGGPAGDTPVTNYWIRLVRAGDVFTGFSSWDGIVWEQVWDPQTVVMSSKVLIGLCLTSHTNDAIVAATFDNVTFEGNIGIAPTPGPTPPPTPTPLPSPLPAGWKSGEIGNPGMAGRAVANTDGSISVFAGGGDIWGANDQGHMMYKILKGNGSMTARVMAINGTTDDWGKAGVMIRESLAGGSRHVFMAATSNNGAAWQRRPAADGESANESNGVQAGEDDMPVYVRVTREGNQFRGAYSKDGTTWTNYGATLTIDMAESVMIGLASTAHNNGNRVQAVFNNITTTGDVSEPPLESGILQMAPTYISFGTYPPNSGYVEQTITLRNGSGGHNLSILGIDQTNMGPALSVRRLLLNDAIEIQSPYDFMLRRNQLDALSLTVGFNTAQAEGIYQGSFTVINTDNMQPLAVVNLMGAVGEIPAFPADIPGAVVHWDASRISGVANGAALSEWRDVSGNNFHATAGEATRQPTYLATGMGGKPTVRFNGSSNGMTYNELRVSSPTIIMAVRLNTALGDWRHVLGPNGWYNEDTAGYGAGTVHYHFNGAGFSMGINRAGALGGDAWMTNQFPVGIQTTHVYRSTGDRVKYWLGGVVDSEYAWSAVEHIFGPGMLGAWMDGETFARPTAMDLSEMLIYDRPLTDTEVERIGYYLQMKYGAGAGFVDPQAEPTPTPTPTPTPPTPTPTPTPTPPPTPTPTPTPPPTIVPTATPTPTIAPTATPLPDMDNDGKPDDCETDAPGAASTGLTSIFLPDSDADGLLDGQEDPGDCEGITTTTLAMTNPRRADTDGDGILDGVEVLLLGSDPLDAASPADVVDADGDGLPASIDPDDSTPDADGDGYTDAYELLMGSDPLDKDSKPALGDVDGNGSTNNVDAVRLFNYLLGNVAAPARLDQADVRNDAGVNNVDAVVLFNWLLGNTPFIPAR